MFDEMFFSPASEKKVMLDLIPGYTYAEFESNLKSFFKSGHMVWYIYGNYGHEQAVELVENTRSLFKL